MCTFVGSNCGGFVGDRPVRVGMVGSRNASRILLPVLALAGAAVLLHFALQWMSLVEWLTRGAEWLP